MTAPAEIDYEQELADDIASFTDDPLGYVLYAFPWGEEGTELANKTGPRKWQREVLDSIGEQLRAGARDRGEVIREAVASGHGIGKSALVSWIMVRESFGNCGSDRDCNNTHRRWQHSPCGQSRR